MRKSQKVKLTVVPKIRGLNHRKRIKVQRNNLSRIGVSRVEIVKTRQGEQIIDSAKSGRALGTIMKIWDNQYKTYEECKQAEEEFRQYLKQKGYTRF